MTKDPALGSFFTLFAQFPRIKNLLKKQAVALVKLGVSNFLPNKTNEQILSNTHYRRTDGRLKRTEFIGPYWQIGRLIVS